MPSSLATLLCIAAIVALFRCDSKHNPGSSRALWLPVLWLFITGSRFVSEWLSLGQGATPISLSDGSPVDAAFFLLMIVGGAAVLGGRRIALAQVLKHNGWIVALMIWSFASISWSDESLVAFKRFVKVLGHPIMALIIITDPDPRQALRTVLKRCGFLLMPLSVLFIKYWPELGRSFDSWTGESTNSGVGITKNDLGYTSMVMGLLFAWNLILARQVEPGPRRRYEVLLSIGAMGCAAWLLTAANSATSLTTLTLGLTTIVLLGMPWVSKQWFGTMLLSIIALGTLIEVSFDASTMVIEMLGRDPTLTDRTILWADVLAMQEQPLIGYGFESFWLGSRLELLWNKWWWLPNQAHNGYIETYLNLGLVGVALQIAVLLAAFFKIKRSFHQDFELARLQMALLFAVVAFNYTEAGFKGVHFMWTMLWLVAMNYPRMQQAEAPQDTIADAQTVEAALR